MFWTYPVILLGSLLSSSCELMNSDSLCHCIMMAVLQHYAAHWECTSTITSQRFDTSFDAKGIDRWRCSHSYRTKDAFLLNSPVRAYKPVFQVLRMLPKLGSCSECFSCASAVINGPSPHRTYPSHNDNRHKHRPFERKPMRKRCWAREAFLLDVILKARLVRMKLDVVRPNHS